MVTLALFMVAASLNVEGGGYKYSYIVDSDGTANVTITFSSPTPGSSWLLVPKNFTHWICEVVKGNITQSNLSEAYPISYAFYENFSFTYIPGKEGFELKITYNASYVAFIEEPFGFFFSTQISSNPQDDLEIVVALPLGSSLDASVYGVDGGYTIREVGGRVWVEVEDPPSSGRLAIEFTLPNLQANLITLTEGCFRVEAASRYMDLAQHYLSLYSEVYPSLQEIFEVELEEIEVKLYVPSMEDVASGVGGFVPFRAGRPGAINLNLFYVRAVEGTMELIALHELVHHFLWKVGIQPSRLWVHEGLAEYISIELGKNMGLGEGVEEHEEEIVEIASNLNNLGFIQDWSFEQQGDLTPYYAASYHIFKTLGDEFGGLNFYHDFFNYVAAKGEVSDDVTVIECLSLAANQSLFERFREWGFELPPMDLSEARLLAERQAEGLPSWCQPARMIARLFLKISYQLEEAGFFALAEASVKVATWISKNASVLSLFIYSLIVASLVTSIWFFKHYQALK